MDNQSKEFIVSTLRDLFIEFMNKLSQIPGAHVQKQQAFLRFDEGHMWMQNAVLSKAPEIKAPNPEIDAQPSSEMSE